MILEIKFFENLKKKSIKVQQYSFVFICISLDCLLISELSLYDSHWNLQFI